MKQIREVTDVSAYLILRADGTEVATVHIRYKTACQVDVYNYGEGNPTATKKPFQQARVSGYGYDKETAALAGMELDGITLTNHCGARLQPENPAGFPRDFQAPAGYRLANYSQETGLYRDCYRESGLDYLRAIGYRVLRGI